MTSPPKQERLLNLVSFLLRARRPVPWEEIRRTVDGYNDANHSDATVSRRFERDKATLRDMGIPLQFETTDTPGGDGYRIPRKEAFLPRIELTPEETAALAMVGHFAQSDVAEPVAAPLRSALQKLQFDSPIPGPVQATVEERYLFHRMSQGEGGLDAGNLRALADAVVNNRIVKFTYYAIGSDKVSERKVDPYGIGFHNGHWHLVGRSHERRAIRNFRIDRIRGIVKPARPNAAKPDFEPPEDFSLEDHLGRPPWTFGDRRPAEAVVRFTPKVAWMVKDSLDAGDEWTDSDGGGGTLRRSMTDANAMLAWVLRFGPEAVIVAPGKLRARAIATLKAVRDLHTHAR